MKYTRPQIVKWALAGTFFAVLIAAIGLNFYFVGELQRQGKEPVRIIPTVTPEKEVIKGPKGDKGDSVTSEQIQQAIYDYCAETGICSGQVPSIEVVFAAVSSYCQNDRCKGTSGKDAQPVTSEQIRVAVETYYAGDKCHGAVGSTGTSGTNGTNGVDGRSPVLACVIRTTNNVATRYVAWKYETEADALYRDLYKLPPWADCTSPIDLRSA